MRRAARIDANQTELVEFFRKAGASVLCTHTLGQGAPDIIVGYRGLNELVEIKDGDKPPSQRKLTPDEKEFHLDWKGSIYVVKSIEDAKSLLKEMSA